MVWRSADKSFNIGLDVFQHEVINFYQPPWVTTTERGQKYQFDLKGNSAILHAGSEPGLQKCLSKTTISKFLPVQI